MAVFFVLSGARLGESRERQGIETSLKEAHAVSVDNKKKREKERFTC